MQLDNLSRDGQSKPKARVLPRRCQALKAAFLARGVERWDARDRVREVAD